MDKKIKAEWLKALRSGRYRQCRGALCNGEGYCCLGVLCDVMNRKKMLPKGWLWEPIGSKRWDRSGRKWTATLDGEVEEAVGFNGRVTTTLIRMNDNGTPFTEIADWIEQNC